MQQQQEVDFFSELEEGEIPQVNPEEQQMAPALKLSQTFTSAEHDEEALTPRLSVTCNHHIEVEGTNNNASSHSSEEGNEAGMIITKKVKKFNTATVPKPPVPEP